MIAQRIRRRYGLLASLTAIVAVGVALSVHAAYTSSSSDGDIKDSCKDFSVTGAGVLSANCNVWDANGNVVSDATRAHTIDLDDRVDFDGTKLQCNESGSFSGSCEDETVGLFSDKLELKATCSSKIVKMRIDDLMYNNGAEILGSTPGLYWSGSC